MIPDAAVKAAGEALQRYMVGDDLERVPTPVTLDAADGWVAAIDNATETAMPAVIAAALPHLDYKAARVVRVDPRHTSQTCACCGVIAAASRRSQAEFVCVGCGHAANADHNAAVNIVNRAGAGPVVEAAHVAV